jgi:hypothetical protein
MDWKNWTPRDDIEEDDQLAMAPVEAALKPWFDSHAKPAWRPVIAGRVANMLNKLSARFRADEYELPRGFNFRGRCMAAAR